MSGYKKLLYVDGFEINGKPENIRYVRDKLNKLEQQLKQTQGRLKDAESVIEFYTKDDNWVEPWSDNCDVVDRDNLEGGEKAREYFKKYGDGDE
jgi:hypothetical protein